jgi:hypothetical protein
VNKMVEQLEDTTRGTCLAQMLQDLQLSRWPRSISHGNFQRNPFLQPKFAIVRGM